jgi:pilus assembly protein CpaE
MIKVFSRKAYNRSGASGALKPAEFDRALGAAADCVMENRPKPLIEAATLGEPAIRRCNPFKAEIARLAQTVSGQSPAGAPGLLARMFRR